MGGGPCEGVGGGRPWGAGPEGLCSGGRASDFARYRGKFYQQDRFSKVRVVVGSVPVALHIAGEVGEGFGASFVFESEGERCAVAPSDLALAVGFDARDPVVLLEPADADVGSSAGD